uniref:Mitochondrial proton/calcium exchanger protein n=1 Tax=Aplysia californica TaxID=6500 RepID=A0A0P0IAL0_APLCA|nr:mitochondrial LETM1 and EF-hand domain-containing protein 1 [Aplysia californica]
MSSFLLKQVSGLRNNPVLGGRWSFFYCKYCSSVFIDNATKNRSPQKYSASAYPQVFPSDHPTLQSSIFKSKYLIHGGDVRAASLAQYRFPIRHVSSVYESSSPVQTSYSLLLNNRLAIQSSLFQHRGFHTSVAWRKEESKLEKTVKALKDSAKEAKEEKQQVVPVEEETALTPAKKTLTQRFVAACKHYYHGFRLLFIDFRICSKLIWQVLNGKSLTRREHNQLVRTTADLFRLLPMLVFILVPFAEFLLPVVLTLFPNMLPSTFKEEKDEKEKIKKTLKAKIEMAKFLQKTIKESPVEAKKKDGQTAESFGLFLDKIRKEGIKPNTKDIMKFAKLFEDEITLDNLSRQQLRACCIMLNITPRGSDALLRFLLEMKLRGLLADDKMIQKEGLDSLTISELQSANRARGMRALGVSENRLRDQLKQWLQLHLEEQIPPSLLLLSRALYLPETLSTEEKLGATITQLADTAADEAKVKVAEMVGETVDNKTKLDVIKHEEAIIAAEKEQMAKEEKLIEEQAERERAEAEAKAAETAMETQGEDIAKTLETSPDEVLVDHAEVAQPSSRETLMDPAASEFTAKDLDEMESVLEEVAKAKKIDIEVDALKGLKEEITDYKEDLEDLKEVAVVSGSDHKQYGESKAAKRLAKKVSQMISRLDSKVVDLQEEKSSIQEKMSMEEKSLEEELGDTQQAQEQIDKYKTNIISINEMVDALKRLKKIPDDSKLLRMFEVLDQDKDGNIDINHALQVLEVLSQEHLKLNERQVEEITNLLKHEALLEDEERREEKEKKEEENRLKEQKEQQQN